MSVWARYGKLFLGAINVVVALALLIGGYHFSKCFTEAQVREALIAIGSISAVLWTGGIITRQLMPYLSMAMKGAIQFLGFGFFAPMLALIAHGPMLRWTAILFVLFYVPVSVQNVAAVIKVRKKTLPVPTGLNAERYYKDVQDFTLLFFVTVVAIVILAVVPEPRLAMWIAVVLDFIAYQVILATLFSATNDPTLLAVLVGNAITLRNLNDTLRHLSGLSPQQPTSSQAPAQQPAPPPPPSSPP